MNNVQDYDGRKRDLAERQLINDTLESVDDVLVEPPVIGRLFNKNHNKLVISELKEHTGSSVCNSDTSWGPSFVSTVEGTFCDMATKTLYSLCPSSGLLGDEECFDLDEAALRGLRSLTQFGWSIFERWTEENSADPIPIISSVVG